MEVKCKVWIEADGLLCFGAGKARILRAVEATGSLSQATKRLDMSYRHAWSSIRAAEERLGRPLLSRTRGGKQRGGAELTPYAKEMLGKFERMEREVRSRTDRCFLKVFGQSGGNGL